MTAVGGQDESAVVWEMVGHSGGRLLVPEFGVSLTIPAGSVPPEVNYKLYVGVLNRTNLSLALNEKQVS